MAPRFVKLGAEEPEGRPHGSLRLFIGSCFLVPATGLEGMAQSCVRERSVWISGGCQVLEQLPQDSGQGTKLTEFRMILDSAHRHVV